MPFCRNTSVPSVKAGILRSSKFFQIGRNLRSVSKEKRVVCFSASGGKGQKESCFRQCGPDLEHCLLADFNRTWFYITWLFNISGACAGYGNDPALSGLAVISGNGGGPLERFTVGFLIRPGRKDNVASSRAPNMKPPVIGFGDLEGQQVVICICLTGYDLPSVREFVLVNTGPSPLNNVLGYGHEVTG